MKLTTAYLFSGSGIDTTTGWVTLPESREFGELMTFTVVRAVRGSEFSAPEPNDKLQLVVRTPSPSISAAGMDIPCVEEVLHLDFVNLEGIPPARGANLSMSDFAKTIPGALG